MEEKAKRKDKPKRRIVSPTFIIVAIGLIAVTVITAYIIAPQSSDLGWPTSTRNAIETQNSINLTLISASQTASNADEEINRSTAIVGSSTASAVNAITTQAATNNALRTQAAATLDSARGTISLPDARLTATALGELWHFATATPE